MSLLGGCYYSTCRTRVGHALARALVSTCRRTGLGRGFRMPLDALELEHPGLAGLMRLWPKIHWSSGDGMMPPEQLLTMYRLAIEWPGRGDVVELGAWVGLTTSYLATACRVRGDGRVYAVDPFAGDHEGGTRYASIAAFGGSTLAAFEDRIRRAGVEDRVEALVGYTHEVAGVYPGRAIRFLLIDADHSYTGVRRDFELWSPLVAPGGLIVFHDYQMPEVARFIDEDVRRHPGFDMFPGHVVSNVVAVTKRTAGVELPRTHPDRVAGPRMAAVGR